MKKLFAIGLMLMMVMTFVGCKKRYTSPLETPSMTKAAEDAPYDFDFNQINNDVIESLEDEDIFGFIKSLEVSGDNEKKEIILNVDIEDNVSYDALELLLTEATKAIVDGAHTQDFRIDLYDNEKFGNLFSMYSYSFKVTSGDTVVREETIAQGDSLPFDPSYTIENVVG